MTVFTHHIYEYKKGLRNLVLHTMPVSARERVETKLDRLGIAYQIYPLCATRMNVFFGAPDCVEVVRTIGKPRLGDYTPEEDFILGTMLGYDRLLQCRRYLMEANEQARAEAAVTALVPVPAETTMMAETGCNGEHQGCTGCLTGTPCITCRARMEQAGHIHRGGERVKQEEACI